MFLKLFFVYICLFSYLYTTLTSSTSLTMRLSSGKCLKIFKMKYPSLYICGFWKNLSVLQWSRKNKNIHLSAWNYVRTQWMLTFLPTYIFNLNLQELSIILKKEPIKLRTLFKVNANGIHELVSVSFLEVKSC